MFYEEIIREFNNTGVRYAIVGGVAVNLHGHIRMTADLDIILELEDNNLAKAITTLMESGFSCKIPVDPMGLADSNTRNDWIKNKNMKALNFYRDTEEVDLVVDSPVKYEEVEKTIFAVREINCPVVSKEDLIKMKEVTNRQQDIDDIKKLKILIDIELDNK
ncbi:MAG: nucleotidyltransferase family protein [Patescibacteria group bacterium]|nr:nucleotidyltransferase family protein [Patescibacteria group bacterium]